MSHKVKQIFVSDTKKRLFFGSLTLFLIFSLIGFSGFSAIYLFYKNANIKNKLKEVKSKELKQNNNTTVFYDTDISNAYNGLAQNIYNINRIVFNIFSYKSIAKDIKINNVSDLISISDKHLSARELIKTNRDYLKEYSLIKENMLVKILSLPGANTYLVNLAKDQGLNGYYLEINNPEINTNKKIESLINDLKLKGIETVLLTSKPANFDTEFIKKFDLLSIDFRTSDIDNLKSLYSTRLLADIFELRDSSKFLNEIELVLPSLSIDYTIHNNKSVRKEIIDNERYYKIVRSEAYKYNFNKETNSAILSYINTKDKSKHSVFLADDVSLYSFLKDNREKLGSISNLSIPNLGGEISDIWPIVLSFNKDKSFKLNSDFEISYVNEVAGKGVFYKLITLDKLGKRNISFTENGDIKKIFISSNPKKAVIKKTGYEKGRLSLTFDDGPDPEVTPKVLDILKKQNIKATFFVVGENVKQYPEIIKRISEEGHIIGNHSYSHPKTSTLDNGEISMQMAFTNKAIKEVLGFQPKYYRTPFTSFGGYTVKNHLINLTSAEQNNLIIQEVDVNSSDWLVESDIDIINSVLTNIQNESSSQILFHDSGGNRSPTVKALPIIIDRIIKNKYRIENSALASEKNILESNTNYKENLHTNIISYGVFIQKYIVHLTTLALSVEIIKVFVGFSLFYKHGHKKKEEENISSDFTYPRCFNYCSWI